MKVDIKWLAIGLVLVAGAGFEISKLDPGSSVGRTPRLSLNQDIQPYSVSKKTIDQQIASPRMAPQYGAVMPLPQQPMVAPAVLPEVNLEAKAENKGEIKAEAKPEEKKVTEADEFEDVIDEKTGQVVRRKKNMTEEEKAKKEEDDRIAKQKQEEEEYQLAEKKRLEQFEQDRLLAAQQSEDPNLNMAGGATAPQRQGAAAASGYGALGAASIDWEKKLLTNPDTAATTSFIQSYLGGRVSSSRFYKITDSMLKDSRPEMRSLGLLALGSTPSVPSFNSLTALLKTENSTSALRPKIDEYLNKYMDLENLDVLASVLNASTSAFNVVVAIDKVDASAIKFLSNKADPSYARNVTYFRPFIPLLEVLAKSSDASIMAQAQKALADVKSLTT